MLAEIYLGEPPPRVKEWIRKDRGLDRVNFLYRKEGDAEWREWEPTENDVYVIGGKATIAADDFKQMDGFSDVREVVLPGKGKDGGEVVDTATIAASAFYNCRSLTSVAIPDTVTLIGSYAFQNCVGLTGVAIPGSVKSIGSSAFYNCRSLAGVVIPDSVTSVGKTAFFNCAGLTDAVIGCSVTSIGEEAFANCGGLTGVSIPDSVTSIGAGVFSTCGGLTSISVGPGNAAYKSVDGMLLSKDGRTLVMGVNGDKVVPDGVTSIRERAFQGCSGLTNVTIPDSVTGIETWTFGGCTGLTSVTIPGSVTSVGDYAFFGCSGLAGVTIPDRVANIGMFAFSSCVRLARVEFEGDAPAAGINAFTAVASGCKAVVSPTAAGFPAAGESWNGLVVETKQ